MITGLGAFRSSAIGMDALARALTNYVSRPVENRTNLPALYDIELTWSPDPPRNLPPGAEIPRIDPSGPSIFTAIQEQLGLRLEATIGPVESLVIEKIDKPTEN
jgi:uncharacterized protein (TIGR03435 family)